jgi:tRNA A-37 threonylcarbamoyl transferase component Bud32
MIQNACMVFTAKDWQPLLRAHGLTTVDAVYALKAGQLYRKTGSTEVRSVRLGERDVFIKKYWVTKASQIVSGVTRGAVLGKSKVRREFENLQQLRDWGFDAPAPVAYGEQRRARCLVRSFLISETVPEACSLDAWIRNGQRDFAALADYVRRLHDRQFFHCDLFWRNILVAGDRFYLIDAHKGGYRRGNRAQDLAALDAPAPAFFRRTERLRFFLRYLNHRKLTGADKKLLRQVLRLAEPMREKQIDRARRGR